jgi:cysteine desulfurase/selenocysteine lyase
MVNNYPLVWLDNSATTQKPQVVIDSVNYFYKWYNSNIHRGGGTLAVEAEIAYEHTRNKVADFVGALPEEIVFTRGTTEGLNLVAQTYGKQRVGPGDLILVSELEHHSNIVPWQILAKEVGATIRVIPVVNDMIDMEAYAKLLRPKVKIVAVAHASNVLGTIQPIVEMAVMAHDVGAKIVIDGAQAAGRLPVDAGFFDFYAFSGHKMYGPTGIGVLFGKIDLLDSMPPYQVGGGMVNKVSFSGTTFNESPGKFEAGTPNIAGGIGLGTAIDYVVRLGTGNITNHEKELTRYATEGLSNVPGLKLIGMAPFKIGVISFVINRMDPAKISEGLNAEGIAIRAGTMCAMPILKKHGENSVARMSLGVYNTRTDIDRFVSALQRLVVRG